MALVHKIEISYLLIPKGGTFSKSIYMANKQNNEQTTRRYHQINKQHDDITKQKTIFAEPDPIKPCTAGLHGSKG